MAALVLDGIRVKHTLSGRGATRYANAAGWRITVAGVPFAKAIFGEAVVEAIRRGKYAGSVAAGRFTEIQPRDWRRYCIRCVSLRACLDKRAAKGGVPQQVAQAIDDAKLAL